MANNRMFLVNRRTGARFTLAKYYPSLGWYTGYENLTTDLNAFLDGSDFGHLSEAENEHRKANPLVHGFCANDGHHAMWGDVWELEYEIDSDPEPQGSQSSG